MQETSPRPVNDDVTYVTGRASKVNVSIPSIARPFQMEVNNSFDFGLQSGSIYKEDFLQ